MRLRRRQAEARLEQELRYHVESLERDLIARGVDPGEARRRARLEFGGLEQTKEECRDVRGRWLEDFVKDFHYTARTLRRSPGFLAVATLSLALGIGANTAIFSLINALMLRPLPVENPDRLVHITRVTAEGAPRSVSYPLFEYFRRNLKSISTSSVEMESGPAIVVDSVEELVSAALVSGEHFAMLGVQPVAGRLLEPDDDARSPASPAAVIGYRYWKRRFGGDPGAIGKRIHVQLLDRDFTIVGITPPSYFGAIQGSDPDITLPLQMTLTENQRNEPTFNFLDMLGRLRPGVSIAQANAELSVCWRAFLQQVALTAPEKDRPQILQGRAAVLSGRGGVSRLRSDYSNALFVLMGVVGLVLLLSCANLSGLLLARAAARQREISIRLAIGAGGGRLMRQFLTESLALAAIGGVAGLAMARWFCMVLVTMMARGETTLTLATAADWRVLAFTAGISLAACVVAGLAPGWHALRVSLNPGLKQARAGANQRLGRMLVTSQLAISMVLVVGAALFTGTLVKLYSLDPGVRTDGVIVVRLRTNQRHTPARQWASIGALLERMNTLPGVASASAVSVLPIAGNLWDRRVQVEGYPAGGNENETSAFNVIAPRYFATVGTPFAAGRDFDGHDTAASPKVAIVNESFARHFFGERSPLGRRVTSVNVTYEIVGVVKDARYQGLRQDILKTMYIPWTQREGDPPANYYFLARLNAGNPMVLAAPIGNLAHDADPGLFLRTAEPYSAIVDRSITTERIMGLLGGFFGTLAIVVACVGLFGAMAFQVSRRVNEIGLRMALGASRSGIVALVLREVAMMFAPGAAVGAAGALALSGLTRKMLYGISPTEPAVFAVAGGILGLAAFAAGWLPARRASRIDPMTALRHE